MVEKQTVHDFVTHNGLENSIICLHSSFRSFGKVQTGPGTIVEGFLEKDCTLVCPAFFYESHAFPTKENYINNGIDFSAISDLPQESYTDRSDQIDKSMGIISRTILQYTNSVRTKNPSNSFVVIGSRAKDLVRNQSLLNAYSIYKNIFQRREKSYILLAGVDFTSCTPIHFSEELAGRRLFRRWAIYHGKTVEVEVGSCSDGFEKIRKYTDTIESVDTLGESKVRIYPFVEFIEKVSDIIRVHPEITKCEDESCLRCRDMSHGGRST